MDQNYLIDTLSKFDPICKQKKTKNKKLKLIARYN